MRAAHGVRGRGMVAPERALGKGRMVLHLVLPLDLDDTHQTIRRHEGLATFEHELGTILCSPALRILAQGVLPLEHRSHGWRQLVVFDAAAFVGEVCVAAIAPALILKDSNRVIACEVVS